MKIHELDESVQKLAIKRTWEFRGYDLSKKEILKLNLEEAFDWYNTPESPSFWWFIVNESRRFHNQTLYEDQVSDQTSYEENLVLGEIREELEGLEIKVKNLIEQVESLIEKEEE